MEEEISPLAALLSDAELLYGLCQMMNIHALELKNTVNIIRNREILDPTLTMDLIDTIDAYQKKITEIFNKQADILENPPVDDDPVF